MDSRPNWATELSSRSGVRTRRLSAGRESPWHVKATDNRQPGVAAPFCDNCGWIGPLLQLDFAATGQRLHRDGIPPHSSERKEIEDLVPPEARTELGNYPVVGKRAAAQIPHAKFVEFADLGHAPQIQAPERFHKALLEGLQSQTAVP